MDRTAAGRLKVVFDALNRARSPDYFFHVRHFGLPRSPIPGKRIRNAIERWLLTLDYGQVREASAADTLDGPTLAFEHDGCRLEITLFPVSEPHRDSPNHRPVGVLAGEARMVDHWTPLRDGIKAKASRYGRLRQPYLVAINAVDQAAEQIDVMQALFGQEAFVFERVSGSPSEPRFERLRNGVWLGPKGPINSRVSGVLAVGSLLPWTVAVRQPTLYHNPWARFPLDYGLAGFDEQRPVGNTMIRHDGRPVTDILRLPASWPAELLPA